MALLTKKLVKFRKSERMDKTKARIQEMYSKFKLRRLKNMAIPFRSNPRDIHISWQWGVFGVMAYVVYSKLEKEKDPV